MRAGDGDGWVTLPDGSRRWGRFGSAGLLLHADGRAGAGGTGAGPVGAERGGGRVLMQHRALWSHQGGTWGVPGGARDSGESPVQAALREFDEEVSGDPGEIELIGVHRQEHDVWRYDTVLARTAGPGTPVEAANWESDEVRWVEVDEVASLRLLPAFGRTWPLLRAALGLRLVLDVDAAAVFASSGGTDPERLREDLAGVAAAGVAAEALPADVFGGGSEAGLDLWFPRVRLLIAADAPAPEPVAGVEVVRTEAGYAGADDTGAPSAVGTSGTAGTATVLVTGPGGVSDGAPGTGAVVPPSWLAAASHRTGTATEAASGAAPQTREAGA